METLSKSVFQENKMPKMSSTKPHFALSIFCFFTFSCKPENSIKNKKVGFYLEAKIDNIKIEDSLKYILIKTKLKNNTLNTITYINYNCSWTDAYLTDNKNLYVDGNVCNRNFPDRYNILPDSSEKERVVKVLPNNKKDISGMKFKIGFIYIPFRSSETFDEDAKKLYIDSVINKNTRDEIHYWRKNNKANIIWSDTLVVK